MLKEISSWATRNILLILAKNVRALPLSKRAALPPDVVSSLIDLRGRISTQKEFRIVLRDWNYYSRDMGHTWISLGVSLEHLYGAHADFDGDSLEMRVNIPRIEEVPSIPDLEGKIHKRVRHELQHLAQTILEKKVDGEPGLLSKRQQTQDFAEHAWGGVYYLTDNEFQPNLEDAKWELANLVRAHPDYDPKDILRVYAGVVPTRLPGVEVSPFLIELRDNPEAGEKYRRALKELTTIL